jgi:hypothetical protein
MADSNGLWSTIKDHPVFIVIGFCAATAGCVAALYEKVIIPYQLKVQEVKIADLNRQFSLLPDKDKVIAQHEKVIADRDAEILSLRKNLADSRQREIELSKENVFSPDDPYPKAFRRIRIGDSFSKLESVYPGRVKKEDEDSNLASVSVEDYFFSSITFFSVDGVKPYRVSLLIFHLNQDQDYKLTLSNSQPLDIAKEAERRSVGMANALKTQLVERYGPGKSVKRSTVWNVRGVVIELKDGGPFSISRP